VPLDEAIAVKIAEVPRQDIPDVPDRVIAATALFYGEAERFKNARPMRASLVDLYAGFIR
jgi:hypothetical protein